MNPLPPDPNWQAVGRLYESALVQMWYGAPYFTQGMSYEYGRFQRTQKRRRGPSRYLDQTGLWRMNMTKLEAGGSRGSSHVLMLYDFDPVHGIPGTGHARNYLYADGHVQ